jgi:hypothetical protein
LTACIVAALASGCTSERSSPECKEVCRKQARCVDKKSEAAAAAGQNDQNRFDQTECIASCTSLQRDREGKRLVEQVRACVAGAGEDCDALLACP